MFIKIKQIALLLVGGGLLLGVGVFGGSAYQKYYTISQNWDTINFTINHPKLVKNLENDYASRSAQLDQSYLQHNPTPQDQLIQEVAKQLQSSKP